MALAVKLRASPDFSLSQQRWFFSEQVFFFAIGVSDE